MDSSTSSPPEAIVVSAAKEAAILPSSPVSRDECETERHSDPNRSSSDSDDSEHTRLSPPPMPAVSDALLEELYQQLVLLNHGYQYSASDYIKLINLAMRNVESYPELRGETKKKLVLQLVEKLLLDSNESNLARNSPEIAQQLVETVRLTGPYIIELAVEASKGKVVNALKKKAKKCSCFFPR